jgi:hypothetical protein
MVNIQKYFSSYLPRQQKKLIATLFEIIQPKDYYIELTISIEEKDINIKELSSYLSFIYRTDGLMSDIGYKQYVHNYNQQIKISEIKFGSWLIIVQKELESTDSDKLAILWLSLKFLAKVSIALGTSTLLFYNVLNKREDYIEKRDKRLLRRYIRELIQEEVALSGLEKKQKDKIVSVLEEIYLKNKKDNPAASRFAHKSIKSVNLNTRKKDDKQ